MTSSSSVHTSAEDAVVDDSSATGAASVEKKDDDGSATDPIDSTTEEETNTMEKKTIIKESFEIDMGDDSVDEQHAPSGRRDEPHSPELPSLPASPSRDEADDVDDMTGLLPRNKVKPRPPTASRRCCCSRAAPEKVGNMVIFWPYRYYQTGWGIRGPQWFGPPCVWGLLVAATVGLVHATLRQGRPITAAICCYWFFAILILLAASLLPKTQALWWSATTWKKMSRMTIGGATPVKTINLPTGRIATNVMFVFQGLTIIAFGWELVLVVTTFNPLCGSTCLGWPIRCMLLCGSQCWGPYYCIIDIMGMIGSNLF